MKTIISSLYSVSIFWDGGSDVYMRSTFWIIKRNEIDGLFSWVDKYVGDNECDDKDINYLIYLAFIKYCVFSL